jgi:aminopeptidase N
MWLEAAGVNTLGAEVELAGDTITKLSVTQAPAVQTGGSKPWLRVHRLRVGLYDLKGDVLERRKSVELDVDGASTELKEFAGEKKADLVLVNDEDLTYAKLRFDRRSLETLHNHMDGLRDPLARGICWPALWDMVRDSELRARDFVDIALRFVNREEDQTVFTSLISMALSATMNFGSRDNLKAGLSRISSHAATELARSEPGGDHQLIWANLFFNTARRPEELREMRAILDGEIVHDGLKLDFNVRWTIVRNLCNELAAGAELVDAELKRDPTDFGRRNAAAALASLPTPEAKAEAWRQVTEDDTLPVATQRSIIGGFHDIERPELIAPFVDKYFEQVDPIWKRRSLEEALTFVEGMFPLEVVSEDLARTAQAKGEAETRAPIRRAFLESADRLRRIMKARAFDATPEPVAAERA